jgi:hypothetical protein
MPDFRGVVEIQDASGDATLILDGSLGDLSIGGNGQDGHVLVSTSAGAAKLVIDGSTGAITIHAADGDPIVTIDGAEGDLVIHRKVAGTNREALRFDASNAALTIGDEGVEGDLVIRDGAGRNVLHFDSNHAALYLGAAGNEGDLIIRDGDGRQVFRFDSNFAVLDVGANGNEGDIRVRDDDGDVRIHLDGGSGDIKLVGADCAEDFEVGEDELVDEGTVLVLGDRGTLIACSREYDRTVAGVVSGGGGLRPGIVLGKREDGGARVPVALLGRVFCKVDADYAPVGIGDLLTTSPTAGHAMKSRDPQRSPGAVIGKAMEGLASGLGLVPILVALQ